MSMHKFTPGPWTAEERTREESGWVDICSCIDRLPVGYATPAKSGTPEERRDGETIANARLIAAAPELLAIVETFDAYMAQAGEPAEKDGLNPIHSLRWKAQRAIAKATGGAA